MYTPDLSVGREPVGDAKTPNLKKFRSPRSTQRALAHTLAFQIRSRAKYLPQAHNPRCVLVRRASRPREARRARGFRVPAQAFRPFFLGVAFLTEAGVAAAAALGVRPALDAVLGAALAARGLSAAESVRQPSASLAASCSSAGASSSQTWS